MINILERAVVITRDEYITSDNLPFKSSSLSESSDKKSPGSLHESLEDLEKQLIDEAMRQTAGNQIDLCRQLMDYLFFNRKFQKFINLLFIFYFSLFTNLPEGIAACQ